MHHINDVRSTAIIIIIIIIIIMPDAFSNLETVVWKSFQVGLIGTFPTQCKILLQCPTTHCERSVTRN